MHTDKRNSVQYIEISKDHEGRRIDNFLSGLLKNVPKTRIYRMLRRGEVRINGRRVKQDYRLQPGEKLRIPPVFIAEPGQHVSAGKKLLDAISKRILYTDDNLILVNKPAGLVVHGGTGQSYGLIELIRDIYDDTGSTIQLVHRLDKDTSGILMLARNMKYLTFLHEGLRKNIIKKKYKSLLCGLLEHNTVKVDYPLKRNLLKSGERMVDVDKTGKPAKTLIKLDRRINSMSLVDVDISTGRTHQIRVHSAALGCPVAGDSKYGNKQMNKKLKRAGLKRMFLHANKLRIPGNNDYNQVSISVPLPDDLAAFLKSIGRTGR